MSAYVVLVILAVTGQVPIWSLGALVTVLPSLKLHTTVKNAAPMKPADLATLDVSTAQLHFQFGLLMTIGFVLGAVFGNI